MKSKSIRKKVHIAFWVLVILAALCAMLLIVIYSNKGIHIFSCVTTENVSGSLNMVGTYQVDNSDIKEVSIDWGWGDGDVTVSTYDGDVIVINEFAYHELEENERISWEVNAGKLVLIYMKSEPQSNNLFFNNIKIPVKQLEIKVPSSLANSMDSISIDVTSSDVSMKDINAKQFTITNTDGDIELSNMSATKIRLDNMVGNTTIASSKTEDINIISDSGLVEIREISADSLTLETEAGEAVIDTVTLGAFSCDTDTADITLKGSCDDIDV
ncbi:MAG TPA: DUF4097 family beta strand repeat-containing protein, partial [Lachnospiraceae bacterium]|nr:DUF4097 family beta strand repeat-containing protein [Lachnospiraceae bacterium]